LALFEELGIDYDLHLLDLETGTQREPAYLAVNPMGKVPVIMHDGVLVSEQPAVMMYLADLYAAKGLAPAIGDPLRGSYLRWMVFYGSCFEPAVMDRSADREPLPQRQCGYGDYDSVIGLLAEQLNHGPYLLGERFTAADVLYGCALRWTLRWGLVPDLPVLREYAERITARPAIRRADARDEAFLAQRAA
jgi:glutathione S-transferase